MVLSFSRKRHFAGPESEVGLTGGRWQRALDVTPCDMLRSGAQFPFGSMAAGAEPLPALPPREPGQQGGERNRWEGRPGRGEEGGTPMTPWPPLWEAAVVGHGAVPLPVPGELPRASRPWVLAQRLVTGQLQLASEAWCVAALCQNHGAQDGGFILFIISEALRGSGPELLVCFPAEPVVRDLQTPAQLQHSDISVEASVARRPLQEVWAPAGPAAAVSGGGAMLCRRLPSPLLGWATVGPFHGWEAVSPLPPVGDAVEEPRCLV